MLQEVELIERLGTTENSSTTVVITNASQLYPVPIKTLFFRYSTKKERIILLLGFLCITLSFSLTPSRHRIWNHVPLFLHLLRRFDECAHHGSTGSLGDYSSDFLVYSLYCHFGYSRLPGEILSLLVCWCVLSIPLTSEHVTIRFRKEYLKAVLRHDVDFIENISPGRLGQRFSEESSRIVIGLGPDLGMMLRFVVSLTTASIIGLFYVWSSR